MDSSPRFLAGYYRGESLKNVLKPGALWTGASSVIDLFGVYGDDLPEVPDDICGSVADDARRLHQDWASTIYEVAPRFDKRQLVLNFGPR